MSQHTSLSISGSSRTRSSLCLDPMCTRLSYQDVILYRLTPEVSGRLGMRVRELRHIHIDENGNTVAAEIMISEDLAEMHGIGGWGSRYNVPYPKPGLLFSSPISSCWFPPSRILKDSCGSRWYYNSNRI